MSMQELPRRTLLAGGAAFLAAPAVAQPRFPSRPVRIIAASAPGGPSDVCARVLADRLGTIWGQTVVVENRAGAGGNIGADLVAKATPDGLTLLLAASSIIAAPFLVRNLSYDPMRDLAPVAEVVDYPMVVLVHPSVPVRNLAELVALARANPGDVTYSSAGVGNTSHLAPALFAHIAGVEMTHVPFAGAGPSQTAILAGQVKCSFNNPGNSVPSIQAGQLRAIAVTGSTRWRDLPDVPTVAEQGYPGFEAISWMGLLAPKGTPEPLLAQLERDTLAALGDTDVRGRLLGAGYEMRDRGRAEFRRVMEADTTLWGGFIRQANIRQD
jgi:tripartite-type tricarboxylate transporter receptor subunit TctC